MFFSNRLNLHPTSGVISVKTAGGPNWDREQISRHYLTVEARDNLGNGNRNTVQLILNIEDVNDNPPIFSQSRYEARLMENKIDFENPLKVEARDADLNGTKNSEIEYLLLGDMSYNFSIDSTFGILKPIMPLDFELLEGASQESVRELHLTIQARDWGSPRQFTEVPLLIYVQDVNDHAPIFDYIFYNKTIPENLPSGTSVVQVQAKDFDGSSPNNKIAYRIQNGAADKFVIGAETGIISVARGASLDPDLTQPRTLHYSLNVVALDGASGENQLQAGVTVNITIFDVNNKNPLFDEIPFVSILENTAVGTSIANIKARDLDTTAKLVYKINAKTCNAKTERGSVHNFNCEDFFSLHSITGNLTIAKQLDREEVESVQMGVTVEDTASETGPQIATTIVIVNIEDINDNNPKFQLPFYKFSITENSKNGVFIGNVMAEDADKNKTIIYTLDAQFEITDLVHLDGNTGDLLVANKIDHELYSWLNFSVLYLTVFGLYYNIKNIIIYR